LKQNISQGPRPICKPFPKLSLERMAKEGHYQRVAKEWNSFPLLVGTELEHG